MKPQAKGWTPQRRAKQAQKIHGWQPWTHATGAKSALGKARCSQNAYKGATRPKLRALKASIRAVKRSTEIKLKHCTDDIMRHLLIDDAFETMDGMIERAFNDGQK